MAKLVSSKESILWVCQWWSAPVSEVNIIRTLAGANKLTISVIWPTFLYIEAKYLNEDWQDIDRLEGDEDKEETMVFSANAAVHPWAMMVKSLNALLTHVAVIAARHSDDSALKAKLTDFEAFEQLGLRNFWLSYNESRPNFPCQKREESENSQWSHSDCLEELHFWLSKEGEAHEVQDELHSHDNAHVDNHQSGWFILLAQRLSKH